MSIKKQNDGYVTDFRPNGRNGSRIRKKFKTLTEAKRFMQHSIVESANKPWQEIKADNRRLNELVGLWFDLHGQSLNDGERRKNKLLAMSSEMNNPIAKNITAADFSRYRAVRLEKVSIKTTNNEKSYLSALFSELKRLGILTYDTPLADLRNLKYQQPEMGFLKPSEIPLLFTALTNLRKLDAYLVAKICISTGCRWSEAEKLTIEQVRVCRVTFIRTKGNKRRSIPISQSLYDELPKKESGRLFRNCMSDFRIAVVKAGITLPKGQSTHVLRHSFASHFMMRGGNILVLQQILGHASITDTMRYSHFSPAHLEDAVKFNPLAEL